MPGTCESVYLLCVQSVSAVGCGAEISKAFKPYSGVTGQESVVHLAEAAKPHPLAVCTARVVLSVLSKRLAAVHGF